MSTITDTAQADVQAVRAGFEAVAAGDIVGFLAASVERTAGTLHPVPQLYMPNGAGHVAVLTRISGERPDGRTLDDTQVLYFQLEDGKVRSVDQFVGDPPAVTKFWA